MGSGQSQAFFMFGSLSFGPTPLPCAVTKGSAIVASRSVAEIFMIDAVVLRGVEKE